MENKAHYALVGAFSLALVGAALLFILWLGRINIDQDWAEYEISFEGPVRGLTEASEVRFNGIKVGEVTRLYLEPQEPSKVIARIRLQEETPLRSDSVAQLEPQGLTGLSYIQVSAGTQDGTLLDATGPGYPRIQSRQAQLESIIAGGEDVVSQAIETLQSLNALLTAENRDRFSTILDNVADVTGHLSENRAVLTRLQATLSDVSTAATTIDDAGKDFAAFARAAQLLVERDIPATLLEVDAASRAVNEASINTDVLVRSVQPGLTSFATTGLKDVEQTIEETQALLRSLDAVLAEFEADPSAFVAGRRVREVEFDQ
jgi:phospholipid/cholesterol/gamma-HCH transport system substrate-binding protein